MTTISAGYENYIMDSANKIKGMRPGKRCQILTYTDGSEWVYLADKEKERFCGFLYLKHALEKSGVTNLKAAENKIALNGKQVIYLSRFCGETQPNAGDETENLSTLRQTGFTDFSFMCNLRKIAHQTFVFDTEKSSFTPEVHQQIESYSGLHDAIRSYLENDSGKPKTMQYTESAPNLESAKYLWAKPYCT